VREGDEVLVDCFAADLEIEFVEMALKVDVEQIIRFVGFEDGEAGGVFRGHEEGYGAADVRFEL